MMRAVPVFLLAAMAAGFGCKARDAVESTRFCKIASIEAETGVVWSGDRETEPRGIPHCIDIDESGDARVRCGRTRADER